MKTRQKKNAFWRAAAAFLAAAGLCALVWFCLPESWDGAASDRLYQRAGTTDGQIVVIGMDDRALEELGPFPWSRHIMASAIEALNADPAERPAAIGVDVIYDGESGDEEADAHLVRAAAEGGNVVTAALANYGFVLVQEGDDFRMDTSAVIDLERPFPALQSAAGIGHVNAMNDADGILRHAIAFVDYGGEEIPSFARTLYERWCRHHGETPADYPVGEDGVYYVPFVTGPGGYYEGTSIVDVLHGDFDPAYYEGKIVLIGPYSAGLMDEYRTSVDHASTMYGVEIQANLIDVFRSGFAPREADDRVQLAILFLLLFFAILYFHDQKLHRSLALWLGTSVLWAAACAVFYRLGWVLRVLWVPLALTPVFVASLAFGYLRSRREERELSAIFGRYVDKSIIRTLLEVGGDELELGGKLYEIAALFVDIRGFTTMSEALDPPTVVEIINQYLTLTTDCVMRYHGTLDKFVGDCTMAYWNAPVHQEDSVYLACRAAMDMVEGAAELGKRLEEQYGRSVSFGIGVHVGPAVIGNIGSPMHMDYTAIGDTVNTAARLEANAPGGTIYITRAVADALGDRAETTSLGNTIKLKGKNEGLEILTLDALEKQTVAAKEPQGEPAEGAVPAIAQRAVYTEGWTCPVCGLMNHTLFCPDCGAPKPEEEDWI